MIQSSVKQRERIIYYIINITVIVFKIMLLSPCMRMGGDAVTEVHEHKYYERT